MVSTTETGFVQTGQPKAAAAPVTRVRDLRLDFFRGIAMIIILFAHTPGNFFTSWIPARWGFSDATEMFVFCSGMASAIAFGNSYDRSGWFMGTARVSYRVWQVYWAHIGMFFIIATMLAAVDLTQLFETEYIGTLNLWRFFNDPAPQLVGLLTLTYVPNYFDILPMYMVILAMMPIVMALAKIDLRLVALTCVVTWLFGQTALLESMGVAHLHFEFPAEPWSDRPWFFNPFGWQLIFFTGFAFMRGWIPAPPINTVLIAIALVIVIANVFLSNIAIRAINREWFGLAFDGNPVIEWRVANRGLINKSDFGILRFVQFLSLAYLAYAVVGEGGKYLVATGRNAASRAWGFVVAQLCKIGQQSLAVFLFSMVLARVLGFVYDQLGRDTFTVTAGNLIGVGLLLLCAYTVAWFKGQPWRPKAAKT